MQSVSCGAHFGGGLWIDTYDHARFGLLYLRRGRWDDRQIVSESWIDASMEPCLVKPDYGFLWWLNHEGRLSDIGSPRSFEARGSVFLLDSRATMVTRCPMRWFMEFEYGPGW